MTVEMKKEMLIKRKNIIQSRGKESAGVIRKIDRQIRNLDKQK